MGNINLIYAYQNVFLGHECTYHLLVLGGEARKNCSSVDEIVPSNYEEKSVDNENSPYFQVLLSLICQSAIQTE